MPVLDSGDQKDRVADLIAELVEKIDEHIATNSQCLYQGKRGNFHLAVEGHILAGRRETFGYPASRSALSLIRRRNGRSNPHKGRSSMLRGSITLGVFLAQDNEHNARQRDSCVQIR
jgi:hypothetical protein